MKCLAYTSFLLTCTLTACGGGGGGGAESATGEPTPAISATMTTSDLETASSIAGTPNTAIPGPAAITPTTSTPTTPTATAPTTPVAAPGLVTIDQVIYDMTASSEAMVIDPRYEWQHHTVIQMYAPRGDAIPSWWTGNRPEWTYNTLTWYTAYEAQGNAATNTRIQIANLRLYVLSEKTRTWSLVDTQNAPPTDLWQYPFVYAGGTPGVRNESSGGISVKPKYPNFHHGYGNSKTIVPQDVRATFVAMEFRLAVDDPSKPDDRASAKYVVDTGADYYPGNGQGGWGLDYAPAMGNSRMLQVTNNWRTATMLVPNTRNGATFAEMKNNPPPLK